MRDISVNLNSEHQVNIYNFPVSYYPNNAHSNANTNKMIRCGSMLSDIYEQYRYHSLHCAILAKKYKYYVSMIEMCPLYIMWFYY